MRGKPTANFFAGCIDGITPAGAGKTPVSGTSRVEPEDHPRRCGENPQRTFLPVVSTGSPPQVRGKPADGIQSYKLKEDHPRRCGENIPETHRRMLRPGSPPQVRGKRRPEQGFTDLVGITPAGAGKTPYQYR